MCRRELVPPPSPHRCFFKDRWPKDRPCDVEVDFTFWRCCFPALKDVLVGPKQRDIVDVSVIEHLWVVTIHWEFQRYIIRIKIMIDYTLIYNWSKYIMYVCTDSVWGKGISHMDNRSVWSRHALIVSIWGHRPPPPHVVFSTIRAGVFSDVPAAHSVRMRSKGVERQKFRWKFGIAKLQC